MDSPFTSTRQEHPLHINSHLNNTAHPAEHPAAPWTTAIRDEQMAEMALAGETLQAIGLAFCVTRERVRQVLAKRYGITGEDMLTLRRAMRAERLAHDGATVMAWVGTNPGRTLEEAARATGVPVARIRKALSRQDVSTGFAPIRPSHQPRFTDETILGAIRAASLEHGDPLSHTRYDQYAAEHGTPTSCRITQRFGSWSAACAAAGVGVFTRNRVYTRRWTPGQMVDAVVAYLASPGSTGSFADYDAWSRTRPDLPSSRHRAQPVRLLDRGQDRGDGQRATSCLTTQASSEPRRSTSRRRVPHLDRPG